jgi:hypothetical protein
VKLRDQATKETEEFARLLPNVLSSDPETRTRFAEFYATVTRDEDNRKLWVKYSEVVRNGVLKRDEKTIQVVETKQKLESAKTDEEKKTLQDQLAKQQLELANLRPDKRSNADC